MWPCGVSCTHAADTAQAGVVAQHLLEPYFRAVKREIAARIAARQQPQQPAAIVLAGVQAAAPIHKKWSVMPMQTRVCREIHD